MPSFKEHNSNLPSVNHHITTNDHNGIAKFHASTPAKWRRVGRHVASSIVYSTSTMPPSLANNNDISTHEHLVTTSSLGLVRPNGTICSMVDLGPGNKTPYMHRTQSLDYGVVLVGEVELILDSGEKRIMKAGDVVVQRATMHAWRNTSETEWARMMFVIMECETLFIGGKKMEEDLGSKKNELRDITKCKL